MIIIRKPAALLEFVTKQRIRNRLAGFVPTMGALHPGHIALVNRSVQECDVTICSIFVNPSQFNDPSDYQQYPIRLEQDVRLLELSGATVLFLPSPADIYPDGTDRLEQYALGRLEAILEGHYRPGHFQGVCQVMSRLLDLVQPDRLFMGQKDFQQCLVVQRLLELKKSDTVLVTCPTLREETGLAMSSRNLRLSEADRALAPMLYQSLKYVQEQLAPGDMSGALQSAVGRLQKAGFKVDYLELASRDSLEPVTYWDGREPLVILAAAWIGGIRLIDNLLLP